MSFQSFINISLMIRLITSVPVVAVALQPSLAVITIDVRPRSGRKTAVIVGPSFNHLPWQLSCACARPVKGPSQKWYGIVCACVVCGMVCVGFRVLSLSLSLSLLVEEGSLPLVLCQDFGPNFKRLPKVSGVTTNHWVFLRCDWSPIFS